MKRKISGCLFMVAFLILTATSGNGQSNEPMLKMVFIQADSSAKVKKLAAMGIDIARVKKVPATAEVKGMVSQAFIVEAIVSPKDEQKLSGAGFRWSYAEVKKNLRMKDSTTTASVYHSYDEPKLGIKDQLKAIEKKYPRIAKLHTLGSTIQGRPMLALYLTRKQATAQFLSLPKPEVLIVATHHAREWAATQMSMRLINYLTDNYGTNARVTELLDTTGIWIMPVGNPDGYEYTFTNERLWRKNLRDNDFDGRITLNDGVDLNRNFDSKWGNDDEGSSPEMSSEVYRGKTPASEPEVKALTDFIRIHRKSLKFVISYHTYGDLILYPWGWQVNTPTFDDPIFTAQAGTDDNPAIRDHLINAGYNPGVGADLYTTNGELADWCYEKNKIPAYTVELTLGEDADKNVYGFEFPDNEEMLQTVFKDNLEFALCLAESANHPATPVSPVGIRTKGLYHNSITASYGATQDIDIVARKTRPFPKLYYSINDGPEQTGSFFPKHGSIYNTEPGIYFSRYEALIRNQKAGDNVTYRIVKGAEQAGPYTYNVPSATGNRILIISAEDYTGKYPPYDPPAAPHYLKFYSDALDAAGYRYDIWDVSAQKAAPSYSEVLSHYKAAIWYTGDNYAPTVPNMTVHEQECLDIRDFMNYKSGKLFATGQDLAWLSVVYGMFPDDFFQYYLGSYTHLEGAGMNPVTNNPFDIHGADGDPIFSGMIFSLNGGECADNQRTADSFLLTNHFLPHYKDRLAATYSRSGGPAFDPHSGRYYVYSQQADRAFKRLGGTFTIPAGTPRLRFWTSFVIESDWDFGFVEIAEAGKDNWTTLPDINGLTTQSTGESCSNGWVSQLHPFLAHYMDENCNPVGTTGAWNGFTGNSGGWRQVEMDLSAYAGKTVELYISYASDWGNQNLGFFVDDMEIDGYSLQDFETGLGDWAAGVAPGSEAANNWERIQGLGIPEGPAIRTSDSLYLGFGFEAIDTAAHRNELIHRIMHYFGLQ
jgi:murein tripeptide amidase MpaA